MQFDDGGVTLKCASTVTNERWATTTSIDPASDWAITSQHEPALMKYTQRHKRDRGRVFKVKYFDNNACCWTGHRLASAAGCSPTPPTTSSLVHLGIRNRRIIHYSKVPLAESYRHRCSLLSLFMLLLLDRLARKGRRRRRTVSVYHSVAVHVHAVLNFTTPSVYKSFLTHRLTLNTFNRNLSLMWSKQSGK